ncbi:MAG: hypothetical protein V2G42_05610 [bacterium JZ-2024 1]
MAFVFRFNRQESTLRIAGYSPHRVLSDLAEELLSLLQLQDQVFQILLTTRAFCTAVEGDKFVTGSIARIFGANSDYGSAFQKNFSELNLRVFHIAFFFVDNHSASTLLCGSGKKSSRRTRYSFWNMSGSSVQ